MWVLIYIFGYGKVAAYLPCRARHSLLRSGARHGCGGGSLTRYCWSSKCVCGFFGVDSSDLAAGRREYDQNYGCVGGVRSSAAPRPWVGALRSTARVGARQREAGKKRCAEGSKKKRNSPPTTYPATHP